MKWPFRHRDYSNFLDNILHSFKDCTCCARNIKDRCTPLPAKPAIKI